jgi:hypothetical protein
MLKELEIKSNKPTKTNDNKDTLDFFINSTAPGGNDMTRHPPDGLFRASIQASQPVQA